MGKRIELIKLFCLMPPRTLDCQHFGHSLEFIFVALFPSRLSVISNLSLNLIISCEHFGAFF